MLKNHSIMNHHTNSIRVCVNSQINTIEIARYFQVVQVAISI